jgi:hypothetical protein
MQMETKGYCRGVENYARHLAGRAPGEPPDCLVDYFPRDWLLIVDESHISVPQVRGMYFGDRMRKETLVRHGFRLPSALDNRPLQEAEFWARVQQCIFVSATPGDWEVEQSSFCLRAAQTQLKSGVDASMSEVTELIIRPTGILDPVVEIRPSVGQVDDMLSEILTRTASDQRTLVTTLTKRTAEEVSGFLAEHGLKAAWLHSEVKALERLQIVSDLRTGVYQVLVGVNLLREGLDLPEVSLVAILDADKEGFLRSDKSLIQTIGRASRHVNGTVILYCQTVTASMQRAMAETSRRRRLQIAYNDKHKISPKAIVKRMTGPSLLDLLRPRNATKTCCSLLPASVVLTAALQDAEVADRLCPDNLDAVAHGNENGALCEVHVEGGPGVAFLVRDNENAALCETHIEAGPGVPAADILPALSLPFSAAPDASAVTPPTPRVHDPLLGSVRRTLVSHETINGARVKARANRLRRTAALALAARAYDACVITISKVFLQIRIFCYYLIFWELCSMVWVKSRQHR